MTLNVLEIKSLAEFAGLIVKDQLDGDEAETKITISECPDKGVKDEESGKIIHSKHIAYFAEYPEEGVLPL